MISTDNWNKLEVEARTIPNSRQLDRLETCLKLRKLGELNVLAVNLHRRDRVAIIPGNFEH